MTIQNYTAFLNLIYTKHLLIEKNNNNKCINKKEYCHNGIKVFLKVRIQSLSQLVMLSKITKSIHQ